jgi:hypothetical protein
MNDSNGPIAATKLATSSASWMHMGLPIHYSPKTEDCRAAARTAAASIEELDAIGERLLTALSLPEALG